MLMDNNSLIGFIEEKLGAKIGYISSDVDDRCVYFQSARVRREVLPMPKQRKPEPSSCSKPKIQRVPYALEEYGDSKFFRPKEFSFGPINIEGFTGRRVMKIKLDWVRDLIRSSGQTYEVLYNRIHQYIGNLKNCFQDEVIEDYEDVELELILLIDGCALLHYINSTMEDNFQSLNIKPYQAAFLERDMFLLENQLPFQLFVLLIDEFSQDRKCWLEKIEKFLRGISLISNAGAKADNQDEKKRNAEPNQQQNGDLVIDVDSEMPTHLLELLRKRLFGLVPEQHQNSEMKMKYHIDKEEYVWESYRSVVELKAAGINFKKKESKFLNDICFRDHWICGSLMIPPLTIYDYADSLFMNLIAYEMCPDFDNCLEVTSYICFLDVLIDHPEDVKELRKAHILRHLLGSDEELAKLFNTIAKDLVPNYALYTSVKKDIRKYYDSNWTTNLAEFYYSHFTSPWTMIAFVVAIVIFVLALVQTIFTVNPVK